MGLVLKSESATSNSLIGLVFGMFLQVGMVRRSCRTTPLQVAGARTQSKGRMRRSRVLEALPCQPQAGLVQAISSLPNIFMASDSERELLRHFFC